MELPEEPAPGSGGADAASESRGLRRLLLSGFQEELRALLVLAGPAVSQVASAGAQLLKLQGLTWRGLGIGRAGGGPQLWVCRAWCLSVCALKPGVPESKNTQTWFLSRQRHDAGR